MSNQSSIEWTDATWNPVAGCTRVNRDCDNCYAVLQTYRNEKIAEKMTADGQHPGRLAKYAGLTVLNNKGDRHFNGQVRTDHEALTIPLRWRKPRRIFVNSMSDLFHKNVPDEFIRLVFAVMSYCGQHTFQILTKRPERAAAWFADEANSLSACQAEFCIQCEQPETPTGRSRIRDTRCINGTRKGLGDGNYWPLPNVWLGTSCGHQEAADTMIPHLLACPAAVRFLSCEPLTGPVDLRLRHEVLTDLLDLNPERSDRHRGTYPFKSAPPEARSRRADLINWVIVGGESGPGARPCYVHRIRDIVKQCRDAGVACFVKQLGARPLGLCPCVHDDGDVHQGCPTCGGDGCIELKLADPKGGDPTEWPADINVRQFPGGVPAQPGGDARSRTDASPAR